MQTIFDNDDFQFGLESILGAAYHRASDVGEVLATAGRIKDGDADSWLHEWCATAGARWADGLAAEHAGHRQTAWGSLLRAASYYSTALYLISHSSEPEHRTDIWRRHRECWDKAVALFPVPGERLAIPYEETEIAGYFFPAPNAAPGERRPLVVMNNGSDGATSSMWAHGGAAAAERGYHWMTFDGPGQQSSLFEKGLPFRLDWEAVVTPVVDAMIARHDVDAERMALFGVSQGGFWVPRALAFEHRFAAGIADPGVTTIATPWLAPLPGTMRDQLAAGSRSAFDREMHLVSLLSRSTRDTLKFRGEPYGVTSDSAFDLYTAVARYQLGAELSAVTTPLLITDPEHEQFWPGQPQELYDRLDGPKELVRFTAEEGADRHCEPLGQALRDGRIFDWLDGQLGRADSAPRESGQA